jgi:hypothetical protein
MLLSILSNHRGGDLWRGGQGDGGGRAGWSGRVWKRWQLGRWRRSRSGWW